MLTESDLTKFVSDVETRDAIRAAMVVPAEFARNGLPTLTFHGMRLHSAISPEAEAVTLAESAAGELEAIARTHSSQAVTCIVYGPGLGYVLTALERVSATCGLSANLHVVCVEADAEVARAALEARVWEPSSLHVEWIVGPNAAAIIRDRNRSAHSISVCTTAGYRLRKEMYSAIAAELKGRTAPERPMRILVPSPLYGGSYPIAHHCADAFEEMGHTVERLDLSEFYAPYKQVESVSADPRHRRVLHGMLTTYLAELIAARAMDWRADLVWAVAQTPLTPSALQEMRARGIHSALWFVEDFRVFGYWKDLAPHFDAVFTIQRDDFHDEMSRLGVKNISYLPSAANPRVHSRQSLSDSERTRFGGDISFVGAGYSNRQNLFAQLPLPGLKIWGCDWPADCSAFRFVQEGGRRVSTEETAKIYSSTKVNLNLHSSPSHPGVNPDGDFVNPRTFEIAACGGFQIVDSRSELSELFAENRELAVVRRAEEIPRLTEYYLTHEDERVAMAEHARARVLSEHTYVHRMTTALSFLESRLRRLAERKRGPNYVSSLKQAAGEDAEMLQFLASFPEEEELDLDKIVSRIKVGSGKLSRPEGLFLLMKEFRDWGREKGVIQ